MPAAYPEEFHRLEVSLIVDGDIEQRPVICGFQ